MSSTLLSLFSRIPDLRRGQGRIRAYPVNADTPNI